MTTKRINLWSGPRNVSTAIMYSFAQRSDTRVVDEPLYGHYLRVSGAPHPGAAEIIAAMCTDASAIIPETILGPCDRPVLFMKQMAHHLVDLDRSFLDVTTNVLLIRDPEQMLPSLAKTLPSVALRDTGLAIQSQLFQDLMQSGQHPLVIDSRLLLQNPQRVLSELCQALHLPFDEAMLTWAAKPRPEDGMWAKFWYGAVHQSTGFLPYEPKKDPFPDRLRPLLAECRKHYDMLLSYAIT